MLGEVFRFDVEYRLRQPSTWVYALVLFGIPFLMMHAINGSSQYLNAPKKPMPQPTPYVGSPRYPVPAGTAPLGMPVTVMSVPWMASIVSGKVGVPVTAKPCTQAW